MSRSLQRKPEKITDLLIRQKVEDMIDYGYIALRQFPKSERHVLSAEIRQCMWSILRCVIKCNLARDKRAALLQLDVELNVLRSFLRRAMQYQFLQFKKFEHWSKLNDEIGRMIGGWIKSQSQASRGVR
ncbi:diversity-generating retroelement protein Avd [Pseudohongiella spirulinae]|uniref:S23 ribosomal protein n=1 Tax=Pseudohongiella spirulinae TaxID=1249552 RepID=A0A0S2KEU4_9GAMM|nr:diversity-generating retroelement protein Avd [Pseudohongiella spirulinae]ALO46564.1 S23 ribosomal protein [Pseudohongiella spirulinae]